MQNRYTGDIGDFGKLGLLRILQFAGLSVGINWYLTPDENYNGDGRYVGYLEKDKYRMCDESLWTELKHIVHLQQREVKALENDCILKATFFSEPLILSGKAKADRNAFRENWHKEALAVLAGLDVIFVDPDNGLIVPSVAGTARENKYVLPKEIRDYYHQGSSIIYYQHKARRKDEFYIAQQEHLLRNAELNGSTGISLKFKPTSQRYYFFIMQPRHREVLEHAVCGMLSSAWGECFCAL